MKTQNNLPLSHKLGSRLFELKHSLDPFLPVEDDNQPVGYIIFDSDNAGALYIDNVLVADPFWSDASNSVGWVSSRAHFCEGHVYAACISLLQAAGLIPVDGVGPSQMTVTSW